LSLSHFLIQHSYLQKVKKLFFKVEVMYRKRMDSAEAEAKLLENRSEGICHDPSLQSTKYGMMLH
jgi:hypothetical protein